ncbi:NUDIX hydrolase [Humibacillus sp. DSM 29435]|uniref:NUDIX hydrolase n=1 Tax=Humibacillus sp. DSM 29435 TaxID=1869167 RepID=UPI0008733E18|nr:NUDIX domain-containing protein [Humibacillus sp. DSM 29435]OFE18070.1 NUDIX hydrolase [Humibacillus sp. DSM 29435]
MTERHPTAPAARHDAIDRLTHWPAPDPQQEQLRRELLAHITAHPDGLSKAGPPDHLTASLVVLDDARQRVLLTLHRRARAWFQFGGHIEHDDATLWHAAAREGREESGIDDLRVFPEIVHLDRHLLDGDFGTCREHLDVRFAAIAPPGSVPDVSTESLDVRWWPVDALPSGSRDDLTPLVMAALRLRR